MSVFGVKIEAVTNDKTPDEFIYKKLVDPGIERATKELRREANG